MTTTRTTEPTQIPQGERIAWTRTFADYSAALYTLAYRFRGAAGPGFNVAATADGAAFGVIITSAVSAVVKPGQYSWQAWMTEIADAMNTFLVDSGETLITVGFADSPTAAVDLRTPAKIALDAVNAAIAGKASADVMEYEISTPAGSRRVKRMSMVELLAAQKYLATVVTNEIARERVRKGGPLMQSIHMRVYEK